MRTFACNATEERLKDCPYSSFAKCGANEGAGVVCITTAGKKFISHYVFIILNIHLLYFQLYSILRLIPNVQCGTEKWN